MKPDKAKIYDYMLQFKILKLHSLTNTQTNKIFSGNAQTPTCYFLLQNSSPNEYVSLYDTSLSAYVDYILKPQVPIPVFGASVIAIERIYRQVWKSLCYKNKYLSRRYLLIRIHPEFCI